MQLNEMRDIRDTKKLYPTCKAVVFACSCNEFLGIEVNDQF